MPKPSPAALAALIGSAVVLLLQWQLNGLPALAALEYRAAALAAEPWRLLTGHWVHLSWQHALVNVAAWIGVALVFGADLSLRRQLLVFVAASLVISAALALAWPEVGRYRGLSGVLHGLFFAGAAYWLVSDLAHPDTRRWGVLWLSLAMFGGGWIKVGLEQFGHDPNRIVEWLGARVVTQAHWVGALCGSVLGAAFALRDAGRRNEVGQADPADGALLNAALPRARRDE